MFQVVIRGRDRSTQRLTFDKPEITIGRINDNDVILPESAISKRHARLVLRDDKFIIVDLKSTNGTFVNGRQLTSPIVIKPDDTIQIGQFSLGFAPWDPLDEQDTLDVDPTELRLLAAIAQHDEASRLVYADWLEERGEVMRAEFLRVQQAIASADPGHPEFAALTARLRELAPRVEVNWRIKVARPVIEGCLSFELQCPKEWGAMAVTERSNVRFCGACKHKVYYCTSVEQARHHAQRNECVAVDIACPRWPGDLEPLRVSARGMMPPPAPRSR